MELFSVATALFQFLASLMSLLSRFPLLAKEGGPWTRYSRKSPSGSRRYWSAGVMGNLSGMFDSVNEQVGEIGEQVSLTPAEFSPRVFEMVQGVSESGDPADRGHLPDHRGLLRADPDRHRPQQSANFETWTFFRWVFKTFVAVTLISNTFDITMAVFDLAQTVVAESSGIIAGNTAVDDTTLLTLQTSLMTLELGELLALYLQSFLIGFTMKILGIAIFVIVYGRMAGNLSRRKFGPHPVLHFRSKEQSQIGQNYLRSLLALGLQGFLIMICVGIYAVLIQGVVVCIRPHRLYLGRHWVHRPALLHPAQDRHSRPQHPQRPLTPCTYYKRRTTWQPIFRPRGT